MIAPVDRTVLVIGSLAGDHLAIGPFFAIDSVGYGWMTLSGAGGSFAAKIECETSRYDLAALRQCLLDQHANPAAEQSWQSVDGQLLLGLSGTIQGAIRASVRIAEFGRSIRTLSYDIELDQSYLPDLISKLSAILDSIPEVQPQ
jgi:hypothetical protein